LKKIKLDYELKLKNLQIELLKYQQIKSKNAEMLKNAIDSEKQLQQLNRELTEMKKLKVKLMNQLKEESLKSKQQEQKKMKEIALLKREQLKKDNQIKSLEEEKRCRDIVLKRKQEEIKALRRSSARMSCSVTEKAMLSSRTSATQKFSFILDENQVQKDQTTSFVTNNNTNKKIFSTSLLRNRKSNAILQQKWEKIDKIIHEIIVKKQTIGLIEREMERFLEQREKFCRKLNRLEKKLHKSTMNSPNEENILKESYNIDQSTLENSSKSDLNELNGNNDGKALSFTPNSANSKSTDELKEQIYAIKSNIDYIQDQISECQTNIIQLDESKVSSYSI
jgi:kinesin family protein 4/21/27